MATLAELLRQGADKLVNFPTEAQRFITNPQAFTQLLTGKNPMPRETGFAAGATGLPAQQGTVLDPEYQTYMQGYEQGEPVGYAGMALPFAAPAAVATAKALAPKAGMMAENYMVKQGMIQPLTAYHGTPHTIQGQFDINKVGTGEGAQAYGHGMYFAENPAVAAEYREAISNAKAPELYRARATQKTAQTDIDQINSWLSGSSPWPNNTQGKPVSKEFLEKRLKEYTDDVNWANNIVANRTEKGNLYKVDIPDADIPKMLDLDKPLSQQPKVMGALRSEAEQRVKDRTLVNIENDIRSSLPPLEIGNDYMAMFSDANVKAGQDIKKQALEKLNKMDLSTLVNKELESMKPLAMNWNMTGKEYYEFLAKNQGSSAKASEMLQRQGITGNRYLDEVSRNRGQGTSNFVVFEPSNVKILEQNSKPVTRKEILEQQINKIE